jgi:hypothetical protein
LIDSSTRVLKISFAVWAESLVKPTPKPSVTNTAVLMDIAGYQKSADRLIFKETTNQQQNVDLGQAKLFPGLADNSQ